LPGICSAWKQRLIAGLGAFLGHLYPVWLKFKGGKGVATYLGVLLGLRWHVDRSGVRRSLARHGQALPLFLARRTCRSGGGSDRIFIFTAGPKWHRCSW
jgi:hypothetical protein